MNTKDMRVALHNVYIKKLSLSTSEDRDFDFSKWCPDLEIEFGANYRKVNEEKGLYEVTLPFSIAAKCKEKFAFDLKICQAGLFILEKQSWPVDLDIVMGVDCPNMLFPFLRHSVADAVSKAGFPQFLLGMVDFKQFYEQRMGALKEMQSPHMCH